MQAITGDLHKISKGFSSLNGFALWQVINIIEILCTIIFLELGILIYSDKHLVFSKSTILNKLIELLFGRGKRMLCLYFLFFIFGKG